MNSFIIILIVAVAATAVLAQGPEGPEGFKQALAICKTKIGATSDDMMARIKREEGTMDKTDVEYAKKRMELMKETHPDLYALQIKALDACKAQEKPETDECVAATKLVECMISMKDAADVSSH